MKRTDVGRACCEEAVGLCLGWVLGGCCGWWPGCDGRQRRRHSPAESRRGRQPGWSESGVVEVVNPNKPRTGNSGFPCAWLTARLEWAPPASSLFQPSPCRSLYTLPYPTQLAFYFPKWPTHPTEESSRYVPPSFICTMRSHCRRTRPCRRADGRNAPRLPFAFDFLILSRWPIRTLSPGTFPCESSSTRRRLVCPISSCPRCVPFSRFRRSLEREKWRADHGCINHRGTSVTWSSS